MSEPVTEQIVAAAAEVIETVTTANGYMVSVAEVYRRVEDVAEFNPTHGMVLLEMGDWEYPDSPGSFGNDCRSLPIAATVFLRPSKSDTDPIDRTVSRYMADIETALLDDTTLGGLAHHLQMEPPEQFITADGAFEGVRVNFTVVYSHPNGDPYTVVR